MRGLAVLLKRGVEASHAAVRRGEVAVRARDAQVAVPKRQALHRQHLVQQLQRHEVLALAVIPEDALPWVDRAGQFMGHSVVGRDTTRVREADQKARGALALPSPVQTWN